MLPLIINLRIDANFTKPTYIFILDRYFQTSRNHLHLSNASPHAIYNWTFPLHKSLVEVLVGNQKLADAIEALVESKAPKYDEGGFIVYSAKNREFTTLSYEEYALSIVISGETISNDTETPSKSYVPHKAPQGKGWIYAGKCSGKGSTITLAYNISKRIGADQDFEIYVERNSDGSSSVLYRIIS